MMKTIGIIGGMSAESTAHYYAHINAGVRQRMGGLHAAELVLWSVDFAEIAAMQTAGDWTAAGRKLADVAGKFERAGAEVIILATNTMSRLQAKSNPPSQCLSSISRMPQPLKFAMLD